MFRIDVDVDLHDTVHNLNGMLVRSANFTSVLEYARGELEAANIENFTTGGLPVGGWNPRQDAYAWPILIKSGTLMRSLGNLRGPPNVIRPHSAEFGTDVDYAKFHNRGTKNMAARQIVFEPPMFAKKVGNKAAKHIVEGI